MHTSPVGLSPMRPPAPLRPGPTPFGKLKAGSFVTPAPPFVTPAKAGVHP